MNEEIISKELICPNCGCNRFVKQYYLVTATDQSYPGDSAVKAKIESAGASSLDPKNLWVIPYTATPMMCCAKCQRETKTLKFKE